MEEPAEKIYRFWRDFRNLPTIMPNLESVTVQSDTRSHWVVKGPMGAKFEWDAEIINDKANELIAWQTRARASSPRARCASSPCPAAAPWCAYHCSTAPRVASSRT